MRAVPLMLGLLACSSAFDTDDEWSSGTYDGFLAEAERVVAAMVAVAEPKAAVAVAVEVAAPRAAVAAPAPRVAPPHGNSSNGTNTSESAGPVHVVRSDLPRGKGTYVCASQDGMLKCWQHDCMVTCAQQAFRAFGAFVIVCMGSQAWGKLLAPYKLPVSVCGHSEPPSGDGGAEPLATPPCTRAHSSR